MLAKLEQDLKRLNINISPKLFILIMGMFGVVIPFAILNFLPSFWYIGVLSFFLPLSSNFIAKHFQQKKEEGIFLDIRRFYRRYQLARASNALPEEAIEMSIWDMKYLKKPFELVLHRWGRNEPIENAFIETYTHEVPAVQTLLNMIEVSLSSNDLKVIRDQERLLEREIQIEADERQKKDQIRMSMIGTSTMVAAFALIFIPFLLDMAGRMNNIVF